MKRKPFFAGRFYPASKAMLKEELRSYVPENKDKVKVIGAVSPHAGYIYSGKVAGELYSKVELPKKIIILSPNHTGMGTNISLWPDGSWETPLGEIEIDIDLSSKIKNKFEKIKHDTDAHLTEHSLEVQIPFIQHLRQDCKIVPITLSRLSLEDCKELGLAIAKTIKESGDDILMIASTDMTHFEDSSQAEKKDMLAIKEIEDINPDGLYNTVRGNQISMCGFIPTTCMLYAAKEMGAEKGILVKYSNSGETSGDYDEVVGYAGMYVK